MKQKPRLVVCVPLVAALLAGPFTSSALAAAGDAPDLAFGAYQRGRYRDAFSEATKRVEQDHGDAAAMALLGELTGDGLGVAPDRDRSLARIEPKQLSRGRRNEFHKPVHAESPGRHAAGRYAWSGRDDEAELVLH